MSDKVPNDHGAISVSDQVPFGGGGREQEEGEGRRGEKGAARREWGGRLRGRQREGEGDRWGLKGATNTAEGCQGRWVALDARGRRGLVFKTTAWIQPVIILVDHRAWLVFSQGLACVHKQQQRSVKSL